METKLINGRLQMKIDTTENWNKATNFHPLKGEIILYSDVKKFKVGDGDRIPKDLPFYAEYESINTGDGNESIVFGEGSATGDYAIAGGTTDSSLVENITGIKIEDIPDSTIESVLGEGGLRLKENLSTDPTPKATGAASIAFGTGTNSISAMSITTGAGTEAGSKGFYIHKINVPEDGGNITIDLSTTKQPYYKYQIKQGIIFGDLVWREGNTDTRNWNADAGALIKAEWAAGDRVNIALKKIFCLCEEIVSIDDTNGILTVTNSGRITPDEVASAIEYKGADGLAEALVKLAALTPYQFSVAVPAKPDIGIAELHFAATATGLGSIAAGTLSEAHGSMNLAAGQFSYVVGQNNKTGYGAFASGQDNEALGYNTHVSGNNNSAIGSGSSAEGYKTTAYGENSHIEGNSVKKFNEDGAVTKLTTNNIYQNWKDKDAYTKYSLAYGDYSHVEGQNNIALGSRSHAEGWMTTAAGWATHASGRETKAGYVAGEVIDLINNESSPYFISNIYFDQKYNCLPGVLDFAAEVVWDDIIGTGNFVIAAYNLDKKNLSRTTVEITYDESRTEDKEAYYTHYGEFTTSVSLPAETSYIAFEDPDDPEYSVSISFSNVALLTLTTTAQSSVNASAHGLRTKALGCNSFAEGKGTVATGHNQHAQGKYNKEDSKNEYAVIVGNGTGDADSKRSNAYTLGWNGNGAYYGNLHTAKDLTVGGQATITDALYAPSIEADTLFALSGISATGDITAMDYVRADFGDVIAQAYMTPENGFEFDESISLIQTGMLAESNKARLNRHKGSGSNAEIFNNLSSNRADGADSHAEGQKTFAYGVATHAEGQGPGSIYGKDLIKDGKTYEYAKNEKDYSATTVENAFRIRLKDSVANTFTMAHGNYSHSEGQGTLALGSRAHAEGWGTIAKGTTSHAEGKTTEASGENSHAEGYKTIASGQGSHAQGHGCEAIGDQSHAEGLNTQAKGQGSHTEGIGTVATVQAQHVQGKYNVIDLEGNYAHIVGNGSSSKDKDRKNIYTLGWNGNGAYYGNLHTAIDLTVGGNASIAGNLDVQRFGADDISTKDLVSDYIWGNYIEGDILQGTSIIANNDIVAGETISAVDTILSQTGNVIASMGQVEAFMDIISHTGDVLAYGSMSEEQGDMYSRVSLHETAKLAKNNEKRLSTIPLGLATGSADGAEIFNDSRNEASGIYSHAEGEKTIATGEAAHAENYLTRAYGDFSHAEGWRVVALGDKSHAEGSSPRPFDHDEYTWQLTKGTDPREYTSQEIFNIWNERPADAHFTMSIGNWSHAEGQGCLSIGTRSHAEGWNTAACCVGGHTEGIGTITAWKTPVDPYDKAVNAQHVEGSYNIIMPEKYLHVVGNGATNDQRSNAHTLDKNGVAWYSSKILVGGYYDTEQEKYLNAKTVATEEYVDSAIAQKYQVQIITWEDAD